MTIYYILRAITIDGDNTIMETIALDADGVLLDNHSAYRNAWQRAFGVLPDVRDPNAYWPIDR